MATSSNTPSAAQTKLEAARAAHADKTAAAQATAEACRTTEDEPDFVHGAAISQMVDAAPGWTRTIIGWIAGIVAGCGTWYYGAMAANILLAAIGGGFLGFVAYFLCVIILLLASCVTSWFTSGLVGGSISFGAITAKLGSYVPSFDAAKLAAKVA